MTHPNPQVRQNLAARARLAELETQVRLYRAEPGLSALRQVLAHRLAEAQSVLLRCPQADLPVAQAKARMLHELVQEFFTETAPTGA